jgi:hypothetical protein
VDESFLFPRTPVEWYLFPGCHTEGAAKLLAVTQPRVSDLVRGRLDLFSVDILIDMLAKLGVRVRLVVAPSKKRLRVA